MPKRKSASPAATDAGPPPALLVVGLGNPGAAYEGTRHNVGAALACSIAERGFGAWREACGAHIASGTIRYGPDSYAVLLARPKSAMNLSGRSVGQLARAHGLPPSRVLVLHDDLDLAVGRVKVKAGGSSGGHNGVNSVEAALSSKDFWRIRVGIGRPPSSAQVADYVLEKFRESEADTLAPVLTRICDHLVLLINPDDGMITKQQLPSNCFGGYNRGVSAFLNALSVPGRTVPATGPFASAPPPSEPAAAPAPAPPTEPLPEPEPEPVPVSRTGLSDGVVALACADDGAPAPKRSKSVPASSKFC